MKILSWNVKVMSDSTKWSKISQIISSVSPDWVGIQESKLREISDHIIGHLYGNHNVGFSYSLAIYSAGAIIYCWNGVIFTKSYRLRQPRFVAIKGTWALRDGLEGLICIYAPNEYSDTVMFFDTIIAFVQSWECTDFIIFDDFNSILHRDERWKGVNVIGSASKELFNLENVLDLYDLPP